VVFSPSYLVLVYDDYYFNFLPSFNLLSFHSAIPLAVNSAMLCLLVLMA
jgi:hypothetical protein